MSQLRPELERDLRGLIASLTGFPDESENFDLCFEFAKSNLLYHNYLDPEEKNVERRFKGLKEKLQIHSEMEKFKALSALLESYNKSPVFKESHPQFDIKVRLLDLLWQLSERTLKNPDWTGLSPVAAAAPSDDETQRNSAVEWRKILREGEETWTCGSEPELSDWSDDDGEDDGETGQGPKPASPTTKSAFFDCQRSIDDLADAIQSPYWHKKSEEAKADSFVRRVKQGFDEIGVAQVEGQMLTEYQAMREIIWTMRQADCESVIFQSNVCLSSVTKDSFKQNIVFFENIVKNLRRLQEFQDSLSSEAPPFTLEAYSLALRRVISDFSAELIEAEKIIVKQEEDFTLFDLREKLICWEKVLDRLCAAHRLSTANEEGCSNWKRAVQLICTLYKSYQTTGDGLFLDLYLESCKPYLRIIGVWISQGRLEDYRDEFLIHTADCEERRFWFDGYKERSDWREFLREKSLELPEMFSHILPKVLISGKSIEILALLNKTNPWSEDGGETVPRLDLFSEFYESVKTDLKSCSASSYSRTDDKVGEDELDHVAAKDHLADQEIDPYMVMAFRQVLTASSTEKESLLVRDKGDKINLTDALTPVNCILQRKLTPLIETYYLKSCKSLMNLVVNDLALGKHLNIARKVFLLEAGDLMHEFYLNLFDKFDTGDCSGMSATLLLLDCLGKRFPDECESFLITFADESAPDLESMTLSYRVDWPLYFIFNRNTMKMYNEIFKFLLRVKRSLWTLQQIQAKDLIGKGDFDDNRLHRVLLLRAWMLHFLGSVHSYFMSRILHSTEIELQSSLSACEDFDQIIETHSEFISGVYDRCFLHQSAKVLRDAVVKVLNIGLELGTFCRDLSQYDEGRMERMEVNYARTHTFLASTLRSMTQKRNVPHLDGLAAALIYSCPVVS